MIKLQIQSDKGDGVIDIIRAAISAEIKRLEIGLNKTTKQIEKFETEYDVTSEVFQKEFFSRKPEKRKPGIYRAGRRVKNQGKDNGRPEKTQRNRLCCSLNILPDL